MGAIFLIGRPDQEKPKKPSRPSRPSRLAVQFSCSSEIPRVRAAQLPAGGGDIAPLAFSQDNREISFSQHLLKLKDSFHGRRRHIQPRMGVQGNEIDLRPNTGKQTAEVFSVPVPVVLSPL